MPVRLVHARHNWSEKATHAMRSLEPSSEPATPASQRRGRNPTWARDELILALDLYLRNGLLDDLDARVVDLSQVLNALPIHVSRPDRNKFRSPNAVAMKLGNFAALDSAYPGAGLQSGGRGDATVWDDFVSRRDDLHRLAEQLRRGAALGRFPALAEDDEDEVAEGRLLFREHRARERNRRIVSNKKRQVLAKAGRLACEVCDFDFAVTYGERGEGFAECHHVVPLSEAGEGTTRLSDLVIVCSNCHRMLHARIGWTTPTELRAVVHSRRPAPL